MTNRESEELCAMNKQWFDIHLYVMKKNLFEDVEIYHTCTLAHGFNDRVLNEVHVLSVKPFVQRL